MDGLAADRFTSGRGPPRRGSRSFREELVRWIEEHGVGNCLGGLVPGRIGVPGSRSGDLGIHCGAGLAFARDAVADHPIRLPPSANTQSNLTLRSSADAP